MTVNFAALTRKTALGAFPQTTASVSLTAGVPVILWADIEWSALAPVPTVSASTGESTAGGQIIPVTSGADSGFQVWGASDEKRVSTWRFTPSSTAARTFTFATPSGTVLSYRVGVIEVTGSHLTSFIGTVKVAEITSGTTVTVTMTPSALDSGTLYVGAHRQTGTPSVTAPLVHLDQASNTNGIVKIGVASVPVTNPTGTFSASGRGAAVAIEILAPAVVSADVIIPVDLNFTITSADLPVTDPTAPVVTPPPPVVEVDVPDQQSPSARPNPAREMNLAPMVSGLLNDVQTLQGQAVARHGSSPVLDVDPVDPYEGQHWVLRPTGQMCWFIGGVVKRAG